MKRRGTHETEDLYQTFSVDMSFDIKLAQADEGRPRMNSKQVLAPGQKIEIMLDKFESLGSDFETPARFLEDKKSEKISAFAEADQRNGQENEDTQAKNQAKQGMNGRNNKHKRMTKSGTEVHHIMETVSEKEEGNRVSMNMSGYRKGSDHSHHKHLLSSGGKFNNKQNLFEVSEKSKEMTSSKVSNPNFVEKNKREVTRVSDITKSARVLERSKALEAIRKRTQSMTHINKNWQQRLRVGSLNMRQDFQGPKLSNSNPRPNRTDPKIMNNYSRGYSKPSARDPPASLMFLDQNKNKIKTSKTPKKTFDLRISERSRGSSGRQSADMILPRMKRFEERKRSGAGLEGLLRKPSGHSSQRESMNRIGIYQNSLTFKKPKEQAKELGSHQSSMGNMAGFGGQFNLMRESSAAGLKNAKRPSKSMRPEPGMLSSLVLHKRKIGGSVEGMRENKKANVDFLKVSNTAVLLESEGGSPLYSPDNFSPPEPDNVKVHRLQILIQRG